MSLRSVLRAATSAARLASHSCLSAPLAESTSKEDPTFTTMRFALARGSLMAPSSPPSPAACAFCLLLFPPPLPVRSRPHRRLHRTQRTSQTPFVPKLLRARAVCATAWLCSPRRSCSRPTLPASPQDP